MRGWVRGWVGACVRVVRGVRASESVAARVSVQASRGPPVGRGIARASDPTVSTSVVCRVVGVEGVAVIGVRVELVAEELRVEVDLRVVPHPHDGRAAHVAVGRPPVVAGLDVPRNGSAAIPLAVRVAGVDVAAPLRVERLAPGQAAGLVVVGPAIRLGARADLRLPLLDEGVAAGAGGPRRRRQEEEERREDAHRYPVEAESRSRSRAAVRRTQPPSLIKLAAHFMMRECMACGLRHAARGAVCSRGKLTA